MVKNSMKSKLSGSTMSFVAEVQVLGEVDRLR